MTEFQKAVLNVVRLVPFGTVVSYGQVAAYIGTPRAARQVGWAMRSMEGVPDFPWWRVLNNAGRITIKGNQFTTAMLQKELLESEGVQVSDTFELSMSQYRFRPQTALLATLKLDMDYIDLVLSHYNIG
jgi:methylated-DNA-protein-cysteine methyltransferase-like protein